MLEIRFILSGSIHCWQWLTNVSSSRQSYHLVALSWAAFGLFEILFGIIFLCQSFHGSVLLSATLWECQAFVYCCLELTLFWAGMLYLAGTHPCMVQCQFYHANTACIGFPDIDVCIVYWCVDHLSHRGPPIPIVQGCPEVPLPLMVRE